MTEKDLSDAATHTKGEHGDRRGTPSGDEPTFTGTGWGTIAELPTGTADQSGLDGDASGLLDQLTKPVDGGRAVQTSLVSVYLTDDGRVFAGAVPVASLVDAAK
ncbi:hypothetical protein Q9Q99_07810 [Curtobacterium flaccumfaciens]|nr:hypothetical protein Q9Q99_07810 [Curtobacterium flaccumfaciens]